MRRILVSLAFVGQLLAAFNATAADSGFPGRQEFPDVPVLETAQLHDTVDQVVIVDTRSRYEFETLRIKGAVHVPIAKKSFEQEIQKLRSTTDKLIAFYCNGRACLKSYQAVKRAEAANVANTVAYDAGVFEWAKAYPQQAVLMGKSPVVVSDLIPSSEYESRCLDPESFSEHAFAMGNKSVVLDVRDKFQRGATGFFPGKESWASLDDDDRLHDYIQQAVNENKTLFIYDEVGKQVRWLQYALEKAGVKDYYFMKNGAKGFYEEVLN